MPLIALTINYFWQQTKSGNNLIQLLTLCLLFFYLSFVTVLGASVERFLQQNLQHLLGADSVVQSYRPLGEEQTQRLIKTSEKLSHSQRFLLTLTHQHKNQDGSNVPNSQMVQLKSVDDHYPIQGSLQISTEQSLVSQPWKMPPNVGEIWLEPRLASALQINLGEKLSLGKQQLTFSALLLAEPDRLLEGHSSEMRAMVHQHSLSKLLAEQHTPAKQHSYLLAHSPSQLPMIQAIQRQASDSQLISKALGNHPLAKVWQRIKKFMGLVSVLLVVIAIITLLLSNRTVFQPIQQFSAICLANGMHQGSVKLIAITGFVFIFFITALPSLLFALLSTHLLNHLLAMLEVGLTLSWQPKAIIDALLITVVLYLTLTAPAWFNIAKTPVTQLLKQYQTTQTRHLLIYLTPVVGTSLLIFWYSDNWLLTTLVLLTLTASLVLLLVLTGSVLGVGNWVLVKSKLDGKFPLFSFTLYLMRQRIHIKGAQIIALGLSLSLLLLCSRITQDVTQMLDTLTYRDQGNIVVSKVDQRQLQALEAFVEQHNGKLSQMYPFQQAQLTHINQRPLNETGLQPSESLSRLARPIRLHWKSQQPTNNQLNTGSWQPVTSVEQSPWPVSVEQEVFFDLQLALNDRLTMQLDGQTVELRITSTHQFKSGGSNVTFWFVRHAKHAIPKAKIWYMGDVELDDNAVKSMAQLWQQYPSMRLLSVDNILKQTRQYLNILVGLVLIYSLFIALLSSLLMAAAIQVNLVSDKTRNGLLQSFGFGASEQLKLVVYEWGIITLIPALAATLSIYGSIQAFYTYELHMPYRASFFNLLLESIPMALIIGIGGILMARKQLNQPIRYLLAEQ